LLRRESQAIGHRKPVLVSIDKQYFNRGRKTMSHLLKPSHLDIAAPTIEDTLKRFLKTPLFFSGKFDQSGNHANSRKVGADQRETTIELLQSYLYYHGHLSLSPGERRLYDSYSQRKMPDHRGYHQIFGPAKIPQLLPDFLTFLSYEITPVASQKFVQSTCMTLEELSLWLIKHRYIDAEVGEEAAFRAAEAGHNLPRAMRALKRLHSEAQALANIDMGDEVRWTADGEAEKYKIVRLTSDFIWLETAGGERAGPIKISGKIKGDLEVGWEVHCSLVKLHGQWKIIGLGGIFPCQS
jgi:hypothetical protein